MGAQSDWTADEQLINEALLQAAKASERNAPVRHLSGTDSYLSHVREALLPVLGRVRADVKAACPSIPPSPDVQHFSAAAGDGKSSIDFDLMDEGSMEIDIYSRDDRAVFYMEAADVARLRGWLK